MFQNICKTTIQNSNELFCFDSRIKTFENILKLNLNKRFCSKLNLLITLFNFHVKKNEAKRQHIVKYIETCDNNDNKKKWFLSKFFKICVEFDQILANHERFCEKNKIQNWQNNDLLSKLKGVKEFFFWRKWQVIVLWTNILWWNDVFNSRD